MPKRTDFMLGITRRAGQTVIVGRPGSQVAVTVEKVKGKGNYVRLLFADVDEGEKIPVVRQELLDRGERLRTITAR
jgi:sRNA-binding carbon storage regulator CsrA